MNKYEKLLNYFDIEEHETNQQLKSKLKKLSDHKDAIEIIKNFELSHPDDYLRSCGSNNFTDFAYNKLSKIITEQSKYIIARNINNKIHYFILDNFIESFEFMQSIIDHGYFNNIKNNNKKILAHFTSENELTIGKKSIEEKKFILQDADITSIVKKKYYSFNATHLNLQSQIAALGCYFGYSTKLACNDKNRHINDINLNEVTSLNLPDLNIANLNSGYETNKIDHIDIIWADKPFNEITYGFELELSNNLIAAFHRLFIYGQQSKYFKTNLVIITPHEHDCYVLKNIFLTYTATILNTFNFYYLSTNDLIETLSKRNVVNQPKELESFFLSKCKLLFSN